MSPGRETSHSKARGKEMTVRMGELKVQEVRIPLRVRARKVGQEAVERFTGGA